MIPLTDDTKALVAAQLTGTFVQAVTSKPGELRDQSDSPDAVWHGPGSVGQRVLTVYQWYRDHLA